MKEISGCSSKQIIIFVEGDTDVFEVRNPLIVNWDSIRSKIKRMGVESFTRIGVSNSIEDWILDDVDGICSYLKLKQTPQ